MAIKQQPVLSKGDFETALITLRLSVSEVSRESGVPRHIVSHFRNYGDGLKPEQAAKLRDFFESKGVEFTDEQEAPAFSSQPSDNPALTLPFTFSDDGLTQRTALVCRHFFIDERITVDQIKEAGERILDSFEQAKALMGIELVSRWASDSYDEVTETKLRELWGHLARIGLVSLHLQGRILIDPNRILAGSLPEGGKEDPKTLGDLLTNTYRDAVAELNTYIQPPEANPDEGEATE